MALMTQRASWFAVQVETLKEKLVARVLEWKGYDCFLPLRRPEARRSLRSYALFPGYLFCRFDLSDRRSLVVTTPGVLRLVGRGALPEPVPDHEIEALHRIVDSPLPYEPVEVETGGPVRIVAGPLRGLEGVLCQVKAPCRVVIEVSLLQRAVAVEVDARWVVPAWRRDEEARHHAGLALVSGVTRAARAAR